MARRTVSLTMIVRNEAEHLDQCLESVKDLVDEMIVCDTGSDDDTVAIAERHGAKVIRFDWCQDFAAARNASCEPATGEVIFTLDGDEYLSEDARRAFHDEIARLKPGHVMSVPILNFYDPDHLVPEMTHESEMVRILWNSSDFRWHRPVHVQVVNAQTESTPPIQPSNLTLYHYGYLPKAWNEKNKRARVEILETMVREEPHLAHNHYFLAKMHFIEGRHAEAAEAMERAIEIAGPGAEDRWLPSAHGILCSALLHCGEREALSAASMRAIDRHPGDGTAQFNRAVAEFHEGDLDAAAQRLQALLRERPPVEDRTILTYKAQHWLGRIALLRSNAPAALRLFEPGLRFASDNPVVILWNAEALALTGKTEQALASIGKISAQERDSPHADYVRALSHLGERRNAEAIPLLRRLVEANHRTRSARLYLGLALQLTGDIAGAEEQFRAILDTWPEDAGVTLALMSLLIDNGRGLEAIEIYGALPPAHPAKVPAVAALQRAGLYPDQG